MSNQIPLLISGPTASGKSSLAITLAKELKGVIINADTIQFYKHLDIGSAKPTKEEFALADHRNYNIFDQNSEITANEFYKLTSEAIRDVQREGKLPILVGGSGLYLSTFLSGYTLTLPKGDREFRLRYSSFNNEELFNELKKLDPNRAEEISPNDRFRIERALEIIHKMDFQVSKSYKEIMREGGNICFTIIPVWEREILYHRINQRVDEMFKAGLVEEVKEVLKIYPESHIALKSIGYAQIKESLLKKESSQVEQLSKETLIEVVDKIKQLTRNYAKRQLTFWRNEPIKRDWLAHPELKFAKDSKIKDFEGISVTKDELIQRVIKRLSNPFSKSEIWYIKQPIGSQDSVPVSL